jgi:hypothetical protein
MTQPSFTPTPRSDFILTASDRLVGVKDITPFAVQELCRTLERELFAALEELGRWKASHTGLVYDEARQASQIAVIAGELEAAEARAAEKERELKSWRERKGMADLLEAATAMQATGASAMHIVELIRAAAPSGEEKR